MRSTYCLQSSSMEWSENLLKAPSKALEAAELVPAAPGTRGHLQALRTFFSMLELACAYPRESGLPLSTEVPRRAYCRITMFSALPLSANCYFVKKRRVTGSSKRTTMASATPMKG